MRRHYQRGAAFVETAFTIFLFIGVLGLVTNASRFGVLTERAQIGVRVAGLIGGQQDPYHSYSLNSVYQALDNTYQAYGANSEFALCSKPKASSLTQGAPFDISAGAAEFWTPTDISQPLCTGEEALFHNGIVGTSNDIIVQQTDYEIAATSQSWNSFASSPIAQTLKVDAKAHFFAPSSVTTLLQCYTVIGDTVNQSLHPSIPQTNDPGPPAPLSAGTVNAIRSSVVVAPKPCQALAQITGPYATLPTPPVQPTVPSGPGNPPSNPPTPPGGSHTPTPVQSPPHHPVTPPTPTPVVPPHTPAPPVTPKPIVPPEHTPQPAPKPTFAPIAPVPTPAPTQAPATPAPTKAPSIPTPAPATPAPTAPPQPTQAPATPAPAPPTATPQPAGTPPGDTSGGSGGGTFAF